MISDILVPMLAQRFPGRFEIEKPGVCFPAIHPDVGEVIVQDDGDEITIYLGHFTHSHFSNYDDIPIAEKERRIADDVAGFLEKLFADQVVMWGSHNGCGGWHYVESGESLLRFLRTEYVWSGPRTRS